MDSRNTASFLSFWHLYGSKLTAGVFFLYNSLSRYNTTKYVSLRGYNTDKYCVTTNHQSSTARFFLLIFVKEIETYGKRNRHLLVLYVFFVLINAWTTVMHYFFHFAIYNEGLKSVLLYIRYLLLTVLSKAEFFSFRGAIPKFHFARAADCFSADIRCIQAAGVWFPRNIFILCFAVPYDTNLIVLKIKTIFFAPESLQWIIGYNQAMNSRDAETGFHNKRSFHQSKPDGDCLISWKNLPVEMQPQSRRQQERSGFPYQSLPLLYHQQQSGDSK